MNKLIFLGLIPVLMLLAPNVFATNNSDGDMINDIPPDDEGTIL
ncbi:MAG: hypothetical protein WBL44_00510 [Nitrososphaeraceae archaeon]